MHPNYAHRNRRMLLLAVLAAVLLAACSDDRSGEADVNTTSSTTATIAQSSTASSGSGMAEPDPADDSATPTSTEGSPVATHVPRGTSEQYLRSYTIEDDHFGTRVSVFVDGSTRTITTNAIPNHETGAFPTEGNPNAISAQDLSYVFTTQPTYIGDRTDTRTTGVAVNGVRFAPGTAEGVVCSEITYRVEALQDVYNLGLDVHNAHVQPTGEYHYHGASSLLADAYSAGEDLVHVGFAADGFLMYYSKSGAYRSGYVLSTEPRVGTDCAASGPIGGGIVEVDGTMPDGTFTSDWVWDASNGDLDECNGIEIDGTYVYVVTDEFPHISRCLNGVVATEGGPARGRDGEPDLSDAAAALGITVAELQSALGPPPPDIEGAAEKLGITEAELRAVLPAPASG